LLTATSYFWGMSIACSLEERARPVLDLASRQLTPARHIAASRNLTLALDVLRRQVSGLDVVVGELADNRPAWWEGGKVYVNTSAGMADTSSPLHELSEVWGAAFQAQQPEAYADMLSLVRGSQQHAQTQKAYPELDEENQLREALHLQVQQVAAARLDQRQARVEQYGAVGRLWNFVQELLHNMGAKMNPDQLERLLAGGKLTNGELTSMLADKLLLGNDGSLRELSAADLARLSSGARDQRLNRTAAERTQTIRGISTSGDLLTVVSGREPNQNGDSVHQKAHRAIQVYEDQPGFRYKIQEMNEQGRLEEKLGMENWQSVNPDERLRQAEAFYRQHQALPDGKSINQVNELFYNLANAGKTNDQGDTIAPTAEQQLLALNMFPSFDVEQGHQVLHYNQAVLSQHPLTSVQGLYDAAFDTGNLFVHLDKDGTPLGIQAVTRQRLGEGSYTGKLLDGLYHKPDANWFSHTVGKYLSGKAERVTLSSSAEQLQKMQAVALGMHFNDLGFPLRHMGVTNMRSLDEFKQNASSAIIPVAELAAFKAIRGEKAIRAQLEASGAGGKRLLEVLDNDKLYPENSQGYVTDPIQGLLQNHKAANPAAWHSISQAVSEYEQDKSEVGLQRLSQAISTELIRLSDSLTKEEAKNNLWYVQLGLAQAQLAGIDPYLNPVRALGDIDKNIQDFNSNPNPAVQLLVHQYRNLMGKFTARFQPEARARVARINELKKAQADIRQATKGKPTGGALLDYDQPLYVRLQRTAKAWQPSPDGKTYSEVDVPTGHWKMPSTAEFKELLPAEQQFIEQEIAATKAHLLSWWTVSHRDLETGELGNAGEAEAWYQKQWGQGQIPLSPAAQSTLRLQGDWMGGYENSIQSLLTQNPNFNSSDTGQRDNLGEYYQGQGGSQSIWGNQRRQQMLGIESSSEVHPETGKSLNFVVSADWQKRQSKLDQDLGRSQALFSAEMLRHELSQDVSRIYKVATAVLMHREEAAGIVRKYIDKTETDPESGQYHDKEGRSNADKYLEAMYRALFLGDTKQGGGSPGVQKLIKGADALTSLTRGIMMKGDVLRPVRNQIAMLVGQLMPIMLSQNELGNAILDKAHLKEAATFALNPKNRNFLYQLAVNHGVTDASVLAQARDRHTSGKGYKLTDAFNIDTEIDRMGDEALAHTLMVQHMLTNKTWGAYSWDEKQQEFHYDEQQDRKLRGDKTVDVVRQQQIAAGTLEAGQKMLTGYDNRMLGALENALTEIRGNYSPLANTQIGTHVAGNMLLMMSRWFLNKMNSAVKNNQTSVVKGAYNDEGQWIGQRDEGQWQSLTGFMGQMHKLGNNPMELATAWKTMDPTSRQNIALMGSKLALVASLTLTAAVLHGLWADDKETDAEKKRARQRGILDAVVQEASVVSNLQFLMDKAVNPFLIAAFIKQSATTLGNYMAGDIKSGNRGAVSKVGVLKAGKRAVDFMDSMSEDK